MSTLISLGDISFKKEFYKLNLNLKNRADKSIFFL